MKKDDPDFYELRKGDEIGETLETLESCEPSKEDVITATLVLLKNCIEPVGGQGLVELNVAEFNRCIDGLIRVNDGTPLKRPIRPARRKKGDSVIRFKIPVKNLRRLSRFKPV